MINRTKVKESTQIKPGDNGDVLVMKDNAPEWSTPSDAGLAEQANVDSELSKKQDKLVAGDNIHIDGNTISADGKPTPINIGTVISGEVPMVSNSGTDTDVVLNFVLPKGDKGDPGKDGTQVNNISPAVEDLPPSATGNMSLAAGESARATEYGAVAIGSNARANSRYGVAIGFTATTNGTHGIAVGEATGAGEDGISLGWGADSNNQGIAIGRASNATDEKSVAIGSFSFTSAPNTVSFGNGDAGSDPVTRRLVNVTDPTDPQDAATKNYVDTKIAEIPTGTEVNNLAPITVDTAPTSSNPGSVAIGNGAVDRASTNGEPAVVIGRNAMSSQNGGVIIGPEAKGSERGVAIGAYSFTNMGVNIGTHASVRPTSIPNYADSIGAYCELPRQSAANDYAVALGSYSVATEGKTVSVGSGVTTLSLSDDMTEEQRDIARIATNVPTRRIVNVTDPRDAQDAATKNYVDTQLTPINAKLQYVPENTNQILSQIQTNVEKAQSAADAKVASITAGTGISVDASNPTAPIVSTTGLATQADLTALQTTVTQQAETIAQLQATVTQLQSQLNNLTLETERI